MITACCWMASRSSSVRAIRCSCRIPALRPPAAHRRHLDMSDSRSVAGWTYDSQGGRFGLNDAAGPFHDNGRIPDGRLVAFLQKSGSLQQRITGLEPGQRYELQYYVNSRARHSTGRVACAGGRRAAAHGADPGGGRRPSLSVPLPSFYRHRFVGRVDFSAGAAGLEHRRDPAAGPGRHPTIAVALGDSAAARPHHLLLPPDVRLCGRPAADGAGTAHSSG